MSRGQLAMVVMTDGRRDCLLETLQRFDGMVTDPSSIGVRYIHDDSGDDEHRDWLAATFPGYVIIHGGDRLGFGGAIRNIWSVFRETDFDWFFHLEDDFLINRPVSLHQMCEVMHRFPHLTQMALLRYAVNDVERAAGGIIEQWPESYVEREWNGFRWREHRRFWTTNPSVYHRSLLAREWPEGVSSEGRFGIELFNSDPSLRAAFWGGFDSGCWVAHIGHERHPAGKDY